LPAALLFFDPRPVLADSCGGGGGGSSGGGSSGGGDSGGSSGGSSGDSSSSSDSGGAGAAGCIDSTDVHGYRHCTKFGTWGRNLRFPRMYLELGSAMRSFNSSLAGSSGSIAHGAESFTYRVVMPSADSHRDLAVTTNLRIGFGIGRGLYSGLDLEIGALVSPAAASPEMTSVGTFGSPEVRQQGGLMGSILAVGGYRTTGRRGSIALEGAGGLRTVQYNFESSYHNCENETTIVSNRTVIEARARAEAWLSPWLTLGVTLGSNVLDRNDWMAGVYLGAHSRAFASGR
jgi:hypothetical protein